MVSKYQSFFWLLQIDIHEIQTFHPIISIIHYSNVGGTEFLVAFVVALHFHFQTTLSYDIPSTLTFIDNQPQTGGIDVTNVSLRQSF